MDFPDAGPGVEAYGRGMTLRRAFIVSVVTLLVLPAAAAAATGVRTTVVQGLDVVVVEDEDSAAEIRTTRGVDATTGAFTAVESSTGAVPGSGCIQATPNIVGCDGDFDAVLVYGNGGNDKITMTLLTEGLPPLHGEAYGDAGDDELRAPPDFRVGIAQPVTYMEGGAGNDTIVTGNGTDELHGGEGNDTMQAFEGADFVYGEGGDDSVSAGKEEPLANKADVLDGGPGFDSIPTVDADYNRGFDDDVTVSNDGQANDGESGEGDNVTSVEKMSVVADHADITGTDGADDIFVEGYSSTIRGMGGNDKLVAYDGQDTIEGGDGNDYLEGGFGNDVLDGGAGVDQFSGDRTEQYGFAAGSDQIRARDGNAEQIDCGIGGDTAQVDAIDIVSLSCENVDRGPVVNAFGSSTLVTLSLTGGPIPAGGPLKIRIVNSNGFAVTGDVAGQTAKAVTVSAKKKVKLKRKRFSVAANSRKTVTLKLPAAVKRVLRRTGKVALRLTMRVKDPAGTTRTVKKKVTAKLKRKRR